jgi:hypothetical protein
MINRFGVLEALLTLGLSSCPSIAAEDGQHFCERRILLPENSSRGWDGISIPRISPTPQVIVVFKGDTERVNLIVTASARGITGMRIQLI